MVTDICALPITGSGSGLTWGVLALLFIIGGGTLLALRRRRMLATLAAGATLVVGLAVAGALIAAPPASAAGPCPTPSTIPTTVPTATPTVTPSPTPTVTPTPSPTPTGSPTPTVTPTPTVSPTPAVKPDLKPWIIAPTAPVTGPSDIVIEVFNTGAAITSGPIDYSVSLLTSAGFTVDFAPWRTSAQVGGVSYPVTNDLVTVTGSGTPADPFRFTSNVTLLPGQTLRIVITAIPTPTNTGTPAPIDVTVDARTGGGETPTDNNSASAVITADPSGCYQVNDKSLTTDTDGDGVVDRCDLDSDNDGVLDTEEDISRNGLYKDDDAEGDILITPVLGDGVSNYLDLDSDNDGLLDLMEGRPLSRAETDLFDADHDGVFDATNAFGTNGLLDALETSPDSGVLRPELAALRNTDGDDKEDMFDITSNGSDFDLYQIGRSDLDLLGGGFITVPANPDQDEDRDGIMIGVDTAPSGRGAPGSPYSPYSS